jgi:Monooxygenase af470-like
VRVNEGRWTSHVDGDFLVLLLGAHATNPLSGLRIAPVMNRMVGALEELERDPHRGLLGHQRHGGRRGVIVQYWRSADALERVAFDATSRAVDVWRAWFGTGDGTGGRAGFWHETFQVRAGDYTASYRDVPAIGLLRAGVPAPVADRRPT